MRFRPVAAPSDKGVPYQAPPLPEHFVSRADLFELKDELIDKQGISLAPLTLFGQSGAGKTALAIALAHDADILEAFSDGVLWVSLGPTTDPAQAQAVWGEALGDDLHAYPDLESRAARLRSLLHEKRCLLVIDDAWTVDQVKALNVGGVNSARLITTSRADEITYSLKTRRQRVDKLTEEEALAMLTEWAGMIAPTYLTYVKEVAKRLSYLPLPLSLAGAQARRGLAWLRLLELLQEEQGPIALVEVDDKNVRRASLSQVCNLSLSRFGGDKQRQIGLLGALASGTGAPFDAMVAGVLWHSEPEKAEETLQAMVEAALLSRVPGGYALHPALHKHLRKLAGDKDIAVAEERITRYFLDLVERPDMAAHVAPGLGQIHAVFHRVSRSDPRLTTLFADALMGYFERRGLWANIVPLAKAGADAAKDDGDLIRENTYINDMGYALHVVGRYEEALTAFERGLDVSRRLGDPASEASALNNIGAIYERMGKYDKALKFYDDSLTIREKMGYKDEIVDALNNVAGVYYWQEAFDDALTTFQRCLAMYEDLGDRRGQAQTLNNVGAIYEKQGNDDEALSAYQRALAIYSNEADKAGQALALNNLGIIYYHKGDHTRALEHYERSLAFKQELGDREGQASTLNNIGFIHEQRKDPRQALTYYERSLNLLEALESPRADVVRENIERVRVALKAV
jgi:tetratricopeptide (TPR) repeat protein